MNVEYRLKEAKMTTLDAAKFKQWNTPARQRAARAGVLAVPVLLVNAVAFIGQYGYLRDHLPWIVPGTIMAAVALESIAVYLQWHAHLAQLANDSALRLRLASYGLALVIAAMNYSHYAGPGWRPTVAAVTLGLMSAISPWLWAIHSRRVSRDELMKRKLIEEHAVRLGATRWMWHLYRSITVMFRATWIGETNPQRAIDHFGAKWGTLVPASQDGTRQDPGTPQSEPVAHPAISAPADEPAAAVPVAQSVPALPAPPPPVPAVHRASARLAAHPAMPKHVTQEVQDAAELTLAGMGMAEPPSIRWVARELLHDPNQRRLARRLLDARLAAEAQKLQAPAAETIAQNGGGPQRASRPGQPIAWPESFTPGGAPIG